MSADSIKRFLVSGRVQGVWFRASTLKEAERLGITGHALNLPDGRVEVLACGPAAALADLERWLQRGPPLARVTQVAAEPAVKADLIDPERFVCS